MQNASHYLADESVVTDLFPNVRIQFIHGDTMTLAPWQFEAGAAVSAHKHPHEQIIHCIDGIFEVTVGAEMVVLHAGDTVVVPGGIEHSAYARTRAKGADVFHPVREDYRF
jgi:quercetin dioxygenase-like cupin family protein